MVVFCGFVRIGTLGGFDKGWGVRRVLIMRHDSHRERMLERNVYEADDRWYLEVWDIQLCRGRQEIS